MCSHVALLEAMSCVAARLGLLELCQVAVRCTGQWQDGKTGRMEKWLMTNCRATTEHISASLSETCVMSTAESRL